MQDPINPYAAPAAVEMHPKAAEWLGTPSPSLGRVANGLGLIRSGGILAIAAVALLVGGNIAGQQRLITFDVFKMLLIVFFGMVIIGGILNLVGKVLCLSTPQETGAQGWIYTSVGTEVISLGIQLTSLFVPLPPTAVQLQGLLNIVAAVTFILFLRRLGLFIGRTELAQRAVMWLVLGAVMFGVVVLFIVLNEPGRNGPLPAGYIGLLVVLVVLAVWVVKYLSLLADMKSAILTGR